MLDAYLLKKNQIVQKFCNKKEQALPSDPNPLNREAPSLQVLFVLFLFQVIVL